MKYAKLRNVIESAKRTYSDWRPSSIRAPFLVFFIFLCLLFSLGIEILLRRSERLGALAFADPSSEFSLGAICPLNYFPTFIAVVFGLLWAVPDHDYKRLEPYFQFSKAGGARAEDSLLLDYAYTNSLLVPYLAFKRSHWPVFYSGAVSILISFVVIPLMSGIFEQSTITRTIKAPAMRATLFSAEDQNKTFSTGFSYLAYSNTWLNGTLPGFTSKEYTILPFMNITEIEGRNETWIGETILYEADLDCRNTEEATTAGWYSVSDEKGCMSVNGDELEYMSESFYVETQEPLARFFSTFFNVMYIDYYNLTPTPSLKNCPNNRTFFSSFGRVPNTTVITDGTTKLFCNPSYWSQSVQATIQMPAGIIQSIKRHGDRTPFIDFNMVSFESFISIGQMAPRSEDTDHIGNLVNFGYSPTQGPYPGSIFGTQGNYWNNVYLPQPASISGFVMSGESNETIARLLDPVELVKAYTATYKYLFAFAVLAEMTNRENSSHVTVTRILETRAYIANRRWSRLCQAGYGLLVVLAICLMASAWGRICDLDGEPGSIGASLIMISHSRAFSYDMSNAERHDSYELSKLLIQSAHNYQLQNPKMSESGPKINVIEKENVMELQSGRLLVNPESIGSRDENLTPYKAKVSWWLRKSVGISWFLYFSSLLAFLGFLYHCDKRYNGLPTVAQQNSFRYKMLFSYMPTIIGKSVEPLWMALGVYSCMVGPYEALRQSRARSSDSLTLDYGEIPIYFQLFRSFKTRNLVLSTLVTAILLANLLAVALGGLFSPISISEVVPTSINQLEPFQIAPNTSQIRYQADSHSASDLGEAFYIVAGNLMGYNQLPRWTTPDLYILPLDKNESAGGDFVSRRVTTWGLGTDLSCQVMPEDMVSVSKSEYNQSLVYTVHVINHPCFLTEDRYVPRSNIIFESLNPATDFLIPSLECLGTFAAGWMERPTSPRPKNVNSTYLDRIDYTILLCSANLKLAELSVSVDRMDEVLQYEIIKYNNFTFASNDSTALALKGDTVTPYNQYINVIDDFGSVDPIFDFQFMLGNQVNPEFVSYMSDPNYASYINDINASFTGPQPLYWINNLMAIYEPRIKRQLTNVSYLPEKSFVIRSFEQVYTTVFAVYLQLNFNQMFKVDKQLQSSTESTTVTQNRVAISAAMFGTTAGILVFSMFVVCVFYLNRPGRHLSHLPTTLASKYALLYASNILDDVSQIRGENVRERAAKLDKLDNTYSYGSFVGWDGREHFGVYKDDETPTISEEDT